MFNSLTEYFPSRLEAPILFQPDTDFQSLDGLALPPQSWSETPLSKVDGVPVECAVSVLKRISLMKDC